MFFGNVLFWGRVIFRGARLFSETFAFLPRLNFEMYFERIWVLEKEGCSVATNPDSRFSGGPDADSLVLMRFW